MISRYLIHAPICQIGNEWIQNNFDPTTLSLEQWESIVPSLDIWLDVEDDEIQHVAHLIPTLKWRGGLLGVRFIFQPKDIIELCAEYLEAYNAARETEATRTIKTRQETEATETNPVASLFPKDLCEYLERKINDSFTLKAYILDPNKASEPQPTDFDMFCLNQNPLEGLILVNAIEADRELTEVNTTNVNSEKLGKLSTQLHRYYEKHP